ncbi:hypothetical protein ACS0PU_000529 [Formica fusca]
MGGKLFTNDPRRSHSVMVHGSNVSNISREYLSGVSDGDGVVISSNRSRSGTVYNLRLCSGSWLSVPLINFVNRARYDLFTLSNLYREGATISANCFCRLSI